MTPDVSVICYITLKSSVKARLWDFPLGTIQFLRQNGGRVTGPLLIFDQLRYEARCNSKVFSTGPRAFYTAFNYKTLYSYSPNFHTRPMIIFPIFIPRFQISGMTNFFKWIVQLRCFISWLHCMIIDNHSTRVRTLNLRTIYDPGNCCQLKLSYASDFNPNTILIKGNYSLIWKIPMLEHNHPWITLFHYFCLNLTVDDVIMPCKTSKFPFLWRLGTWFHLKWCNLGSSMILSFFTKG